MPASLEFIKKEKAFIETLKDIAGRLMYEDAAALKHLPSADYNEQRKLLSKLISAMMVLRQYNDLQVTKLKSKLEKDKMKQLTDAAAQLQAKLEHVYGLNTQDPFTLATILNHDQVVEHITSLAKAVENELNVLIKVE
jgi:hypothetical protein